MHNAGKFRLKFPIWKRIVEFFAFTYFNWVVVVPSLVPFMLFWVGVSEQQLYAWIFMSIFTSLYIGWITVKVDSKFAPWFYRKMRMQTNICKCCGK